MAICILVLEDEEKAYGFWKNLKANQTTITNFQVIEPTLKDQDKASIKKQSNANDLPETVKIKDVKLLNPNLSRKERQHKMSLWLMPFGFIAGLTFAGMTGLETFSNFGLGQFSETFAGGLLGMGSGWIGSFFAARSVSTPQEDLKGIFKFNEKGFWLVLFETPFEIEPPWVLIKESNPVEVVNLTLI